MRRSSGTGARARARLSLGLGAGLALLLLGGPAQALTLYFQGSNGYGIDPSLVPQAQAEGFPVIDAEGALAFLDLVSDDKPSAPFDIGVSDPIPAEEVSIPSAPTPTNPVQAFDEWMLTNLGSEDRSQFWLVFMSNSFEQDLAGGPYSPGDVGLELDPSEPWGLLRASSDSDTFYPAFFVGDLPAGEAVPIPVRYRVAGSLMTRQGEPTVPQYLVGQATVPIPEPSTVALLGAGLMGLAAAGRRR